MPPLTPTGAAMCWNRKWLAFKIVTAAGPLRQAARRLFDAMGPCPQTAPARTSASALQPALPRKAPIRLAEPLWSRCRFVDRFSSI